MSRTTFSGPIRAGNIKDAPFITVGTSRLTQYTSIVATGTDNVTSATLYLPAGSRIDDIIIDTLVASDATTAVGSAGIVAGGTTYVSGLDVKAVGRKTPTYTAAQLAALVSTATTATVGSDGYSTVVVSITLTGTGTTGTFSVAVRYTQPDDRATAVTY